MEYRIMHRPAPPRNDLNFTGAGRLIVSREGAELSGPWRLIPSLAPPLIVTYLGLLWLSAVLHVLGLDEAEQTIFRLASLLIIFAVLIHYFPRPRFLRVRVEEARRDVREISIRYQGGRAGQARYGSFHAATVEEAEGILQALRAPGETAREFPITYGSERVWFDAGRRGRVTLDADTVRLSGRLPRDLPSSRHLYFRAVALGTVIFILVIIIHLVLEQGQFFNAGLDLLAPSGVLLIAMIISVIVALLAIVRLFRREWSAVVRKTEISGVEQSGRDVSFLAPPDDGEGTAPQRTVLHTRTPAEAETLARGLISPADGDFPIRYGHEEESSTLNMDDPGRLAITPHRVIVTGGSNWSRPFLQAGLLLLFMAVVAGLFVWLLDRGYSIWDALVYSPLLSLPFLLLFWLFPTRADFPRDAVADVTRRGRRLAFIAPGSAGTEQRAIFYTRTLEDAEAIERELTTPA